jgi:hypothetical protein
MNLHQTKLTRSEWNSTEVPVSEAEKEILQLIIKGYHDVNIKYNKHLSLFGFLRIDYTEILEDYLYNLYFQERVVTIRKKYGLTETVKIKTNVSIKKADQIRIDNNSNPENVKSVFEFVLIDLVEQVLVSGANGKTTWILPYFTLSKLVKMNIRQCNRHILDLVKTVLTQFEEDIDMSYVIENAVQCIEKNAKLLSYADMTLYEHQKQLFTMVKREGPKLILYIAPTGTGKTLSPIGLTEQYRVIFVCAARHVGLALAKSAISVNKKIAMALGCASAEDIRLHYFAAKDYSVNRRSGGIGKVDNSNGEKVELMICDIKSYITAMYYMLAFNEPENIVVYWDEPTITMDYETHNLHETIHTVWMENKIPQMILSSATLPKMHELSDTLASFRSKFPGAEIYNIVSYDCKKTIPLINKNGYVMLPHHLSDDYDTTMDIVRHCEENMTLMRYFDLQEVVQFILFSEKNNYITQASKIKRHFASVDDINMMSIKLHYLRCLKNISQGAWGAICLTLRALRTKRISINDSVDTKGNKLRKISSIGPGIKDRVTEMDTNHLRRLVSEQQEPNHSTEEVQPGIYVTTKDAFTLTDGPTLFLANDVEKIAKFCIQQANIPAIVMKDIMEKIEFNNGINEKIRILEEELENLVLKNTLKDDTNKGGKNDSAARVKTMNSEDDRRSKKIEADLEVLRLNIKSAQLNETFVPNKLLHVGKWAENVASTNVFTCDIDEHTIMNIMMLQNIQDSWKVLLLMGIGVFTSHTNVEYTEIMKQLADQQRLFIIIASSDYIYGTNYQFCHGYLSKDMTTTQEKIIQALGRIGRNNIQQDYSIRFRDDEQIRKLFFEEKDKMEVRNMNLLFA